MGSTPIADAHSDLLMEVVHAADELGDRDPFRSRWLPPLEGGGVALQVCAIYVDPALGPEAGLRKALRQATAFRDGVERNRDRAFAVDDVSDLERVGTDGVGLLLSLEGASCLGTELWPIDLLARLGLRMASLTWEESNSFAAGGRCAGGVTELGEKLLRRMSALGIVPDLAHASAETFADVLELTGSGPVLVSHAACRAVHDYPRNLTDSQLRALSEAGGLLGLMPHPLVIEPSSPTLDRFVAHIDHAVEVMGIDHVGLGGDFLRQIAETIGGGEQTQAGVRLDAVIPGLEGPRDYPLLLDALARRGYGREAIAKVAGGNLLDLLRNTLPAS